MTRVFRDHGDSVSRLVLFMSNLKDLTIYEERDKITRVKSIVPIHMVCCNERALNGFWWQQFNNNRDPPSTNSKQKLKKWTKFKSGTGNLMSASFLVYLFSSINQSNSFSASHLKGVHSSTKEQRQRTKTQDKIYFKLQKITNHHNYSPGDLHVHSGFSSFNP